jgi:predicted ATPase
VLNQATLTAHVRVYGGAGLDELLRDTVAAREHADAIIDLADQHNLHYFRLSGLILRGWVMAQEGEFNGGVTLMRQSAKERLALGVGWYQIRYLCMLATTHLRMVYGRVRHVRSEGGEGAARRTRPRIGLTACPELKK